MTKKVFTLFLAICTCIGLNAQGYIYVHKSTLDENLIPPLWAASPAVVV